MSLYQCIGLGPQDQSRCSYIFKAALFLKLWRFPSSIFKFNTNCYYF
jgi:hypothetical protein